VTGLVADIQRFSLHDGPGIRTTVFLKGCNLRCFWCHNPETLLPRPQLQVNTERCIGCGACVEACPHGAHAAGPEGKTFRRDLCRACGACARHCYADGLRLVGRQVTAEQVVAEVAEDAAFYGSEGGITLSGGEPLSQKDFSAAILAGCRAAGIRTAVETNLAYEWERLEALLPLIDLVMFDIKAIEPELHRRGTGTTNVRVLDNARRLARMRLPLIARTPVVPGYNDSVAEVGAIAQFLGTLDGLLRYELLPYHPLGTAKCASLGIEDRAKGLVPPGTACMDRLAAAARAHGLEPRVAGGRRSEDG